MYGRCLICGSKDHVEMHHIKKIGHSQDPQVTRFNAKVMGRLNRKQIPVSRMHHQLIHAGKYDDIDLTDLYDTRIATIENSLKLWE